MFPDLLSWSLSKRDGDKKPAFSCFSENPPFALTFTTERLINGSHGSNKKRNFPITQYMFVAFFFFPVL